MYISFTMTMHFMLVLPFLLQMSSGRPQQQTQLVTQMLPPSQSSSLGPQALGPTQGPAASLGQILINLLNYKLQWLNQLAGHFTGLSPTQGPSFKPGLLGALGALGASQLPGTPGVAAPQHFSHPHHGFPFMTTLVTTLSGNAPTVPGITIAGAPVNHLGAPGFYPGAPTTAPPQDFHWVPPFAPEPQQLVPQNPQASAAAPQAQSVQAASQPTAPQPAAPRPLAQPPQTQATIPVIPAIDDVPLQTIVQPAAAARPPVAPAVVAAPAAVGAAPAAVVAAPAAVVAAPTAAVAAPAAVVAAPAAAVTAPVAAAPEVETRF